MPYFEIEINGRTVACAGADDIQVLTAHVMAGRDGQASFGSHGMRQTDSRAQEHLSWKSGPIVRGDRVRIGYVHNAVATESTSLQASSIDSEQLIAELKAMESEMETRFRERFPDGILPIARAPHPVVFRVCTTETPDLEASLGDEEYLQAVLKCVGKRCVLEVDALTVLESGYTEGRRWLEEQLLPGQHVEITYAI